MSGENPPRGESVRRSPWNTDVTPAARAELAREPVRRRMGADRPAAARAIPDRASVAPTIAGDFGNHSVRPAHWLRPGGICRWIFRRGPLFTADS